MAIRHFLPGSSFSAPTALGVGSAGVDHGRGQSRPIRLIISHGRSFCVMHDHAYRVRPERNKRALECLCSRSEPRTPIFNVDLQNLPGDSSRERNKRTFSFWALQLSNATLHGWGGGGDTPRHAYGTRGHVYFARDGKGCAVFPFSTDRPHDF